MACLKVAKREILKALITIKNIITFSDGYKLD